MPCAAKIRASRERENLLLHTTGVIMAKSSAALTEVVQKYTSSQNVSITIRDGRIDSVTTWVTGHPAVATKRVESLPKRLKF
jgi:hypothetical protein